MTQYAQQGRSQAFSADQRAAGGSPHATLRHHIVTAVLVSHDGSRWLRPVLDALLSQQRPVQRVIAVDTGSRDDSVNLLEAALGTDAVLHRKRSTGYGAAIAFGLKSSAPVGYDEFGYDSPLAPIEWIWLLHDDCAPMPDALGQLLLAAEEQPEAAVLGPKIRGWYDRSQLLEVGATVAANGRRWTGLEHNEHDQGQHDETRPVLSVSSAGMLVRRDVWDRLRGFDRGISLFRDDLDFCWRVNNAGHKVFVVPDAVVHHAEAAARERRRITAGPNRPHLLDRGHALYTVAVNRHSRFWPALWLRLVIGSLLRAFGFVIAKSPGTASDELFAVLTFAGRPDRILRGRAVRRRERAADPQQIEQFLPARGALARNAFESLLSQLRGNHDEHENDSSRHRSVETGPVSEEAEILETDSLGFLTRVIRNPVIAVGLGLTLIALLSARSLLLGGTLAGGALLPTPGGAGDLWSSYLAGWHGAGLGSTSAAPPYLALLALLASLLFGKASWAVSVLLIGSVPLAGLSASYALRRVTPSAPLRIWGGYAYALLAVATGAIAGGRLGVAVAVAVLPLVVTTAGGAVGGPGRTGSTRSAWTCSFLLTIATAFAPVTWILALAFGALAALTVAWRTRSNIAMVAMRMAVILGTPLVVLAPWSLTLLRHPSAFLLDVGIPGMPQGNPVPTPIGLLLGDPGGPGTYPSWFGAGLLLAALAALFRDTRRRVVVSAWSLAIVGFGSAVLIAGLRVTPPGAARALTPWPGLSTAMLGLGLIMATTVGAEGARERIASAAFGWRQPLTVLVTGAAVLAPVAAAGWWLVRGAQGPLVRVSSAVLPAYVAAEGQTAARPRTLLLSADASGNINYAVLRGSGPTIGDADIRVAANETAKFDGAVGQLLSGNGGDAAQELATLDVGYVLVSSSVPGFVPRALGGVPGLTERSVSQDNGRQSGLWAVNGTVGRLFVQDAAGARVPVSYQCSGSAPSGSVQVCSQDSAATVTVPPGPDGRVLVLAEQAQAGWSATVGGGKLSPVSGPNGLQAWRLPAAGGTAAIAYHSIQHTVWLAVGGFGAFAATVMALPFGRRPDEEVEGEEAAEVAAELPSDDRGRERDDADREREHEAPVETPAAASADSRGYPDDQYHSGEYAQAQPAAPGEYDEAAHRSGGYDVYERQHGHQSGQYETSPYDSGQYQVPHQAADPYGYSEPNYESGSYDTGRHETDRYPAEPERYAAPTGYETPDYQATDYPPADYQTTDYQTTDYQTTDYQTTDYQAQQDAPGQYTDPYAAEQYGSGQYGTQPYDAGPYAADPPETGHEPDPPHGTGYSAQAPHQPEPYNTGQYTTPGYPSAGYLADQADTGRYQSEPYPSGSHEQYRDPDGHGYGPPEPRRPEPPEHHRYAPEHDPDGYRSDEQDGWNR